MPTEPDIKLNKLTYASGAQLSKIILEGDIVTTEGQVAELKCPSVQVTGDTMQINSETIISEPLIVDHRVGQNNDVHIKGGKLAVGGPAQGRLEVRDSNDKRRIELLSTSQGVLRIMNASENLVNALDGSAHLRMGIANQTEGKISLMKGNDPRVSLTAEDGGTLKLENNQGEHVQIANGEIILGQAGNGGHLLIHSDQGAGIPLIDLSQQGIQVHNDNGMRFRAGAEGVVSGGSAIAGNVQVAYHEGRIFAELNAQEQMFSLKPSGPGADPTFKLNTQGVMDVGGTDNPGSLHIRDGRTQPRLTMEANGTENLQIKDARGNKVFSAGTSGVIVGDRSQARKIELGSAAGTIQINDRNLRPAVTLSQDGKLALNNNIRDYQLTGSPDAGLIHEQKGVGVTVSAGPAGNWPAWPGGTSPRTVNLVDEIKRLKSLALALEEKVQLHEQAIDALQNP